MARDGRAWSRGVDGEGFKGRGVNEKEASQGLPCSLARRVQESTGGAARGCLQWS